MPRQVMVEVAGVLVAVAVRSDAEVWCEKTEAAIKFIQERAVGLKKVLQEAQRARRGRHFKPEPFERKVAELQRRSEPEAIRGYVLAMDCTEAVCEAIYERMEVIGKVARDEDCDDPDVDLLVTHPLFEPLTILQIADLAASAPLYTEGGLRDEMEFRYPTLARAAKAMVGMV